MDEQNLDVTHREFLLVVCVASLLRRYFERQEIFIRLVDDVLKCIYNLAGSNWRLTRWEHGLSEHYFDFIHKVMIKNQFTNTASRLRPEGTDKTWLDNSIPHSCGLHFSAPHHSTMNRTSVQQRRNLYPKAATWPTENCSTVPPKQPQSCDRNQLIYGCKKLRLRESFLEEQAADAKCQLTAQTVGHHGSCCF